ncbi:MAG: thymidine kinase [Sulfobacillus sp.]
MQQCGKLVLIIGPMFSSKTTTLLSRYRKYSLARKRCLLVKYQRDLRYDQKCVVTHDGLSYEAVGCLKLADLRDTVKNFDVICIDEIQFYPDASKTCEEWANAGKVVEACGLSGTYERLPFEQVSLLVALADEIVHLTAVCTESGAAAPFTQRTTEETELEVIGGSEKYRAVSRQVWISK